MATNITAITAEKAGRTVEKGKKLKNPQLFPMNLIASVGDFSIKLQATYKDKDEFFGLNVDSIILTDLPYQGSPVIHDEEELSLKTKEGGLVSFNGRVILEEDTEMAWDV